MVRPSPPFRRGCPAGWASPCPISSSSSLSVSSAASGSASSGSGAAAGGGGGGGGAGTAGIAGTAGGGGGGSGGGATGPSGGSGGGGGAARLMSVPAAAADGEDGRRRRLVGGEVAGERTTPPAPFRAPGTPAWSGDGGHELVLRSVASSCPRPGSMVIGQRDRQIWRGKVDRATETRQKIADHSCHSSHQTR